MAAPILSGQAVSWHTEDIDSQLQDIEGAPKGERALFLEQSRKLNVNGNGFTFSFPQGTVPFSEGFEYGDHYYHPVAVGRDHTFLNYLDDEIDTWSIDVKLAKFNKADPTSVLEYIDLSAVEPTVRDPGPRFREVREWPLPGGYNLNALSLGLDYTGGFAFRLEPASDGLRSPGQIPGCYVHDTFGYCYGVIERDGWAIPQVEKSNQIWGVKLSDGTRWERKGFGSYPSNLAAYAPGQDHDSYPWGSGFGTNGLIHTQEFFDIIGPVGSQYVAVVVEERKLTPEFVSNLGAPITKEVAMPDWTEAKTTVDPIQVTSTWKGHWVAGLGEMYDYNPEATTGQKNIHQPFAKTVSTAVQCGHHGGHPSLYVGESINADPYPRWDNELSLSAAISRFSSEMVQDFDSVANQPVFKGMRCYRSSLTLEIIDATTGNTVASSPIANKIGTQRRIPNERSELDVTVSSDFGSWSLYDMGDGIVDEETGDIIVPPNENLRGFWKPANTQPTGSRIGGGENGSFENEGWGRWGHFIREAVYDRSPDPDLVQYQLRSMDAGVCAGSTGPSGEVDSPSGIYLYHGQEGVSPPADGFNAVRRILSTAYAHGPTTEIGYESACAPCKHSTSHYVEGNNRLIFLSRPRTAEPRYTTDQLVTPPLATESKPDEVIAWNAVVRDKHKITAYDFDPVNGTLTQAWEVDALQVAGESFYNPSGFDPGLRETAGDCVSNGVLTGKYLYVVIRGRWEGGINSLSDRLVKILAWDETTGGAVTMPAGTVVATYPVESQQPDLNTHCENLIIHNRRPVALVKPSGQPDTFVLERR